MNTKTLVFVLSTALSAVCGQYHEQATSSQFIVHHKITHDYTSHKIQPQHYTPIHQVAYQLPKYGYGTKEIQPVHYTPVHVVPAHHPPNHEHKGQKLQQVHSTPILHIEPELQLPKENHEEHQDYYAQPKYVYEYKGEDPQTGDNKYQYDSRDGDVVKGAYSLHQPDGSIRTVEYNSDHHTGFIVNVKHPEPTKHHC